MEKEIKVVFTLKYDSDKAPAEEAVSELNTQLEFVNDNAETSMDLYIGHCRELKKQRNPQAVPPGHGG